MKFSTKICIAALATGVAFPALAQDYGTSTTTSDDARPQEKAGRKSTTTATNSTTKSFVPCSFRNFANGAR